LRATGDISDFVFDSEGVLLTKSVAGAFAFLSLCCLSAKGYVKLGNNTLQSNGSPGDTQAAINAARPGSTVEIPNGTYSWNSGVTVEGKAIRLRGQSVGRVTITNHSTLERDVCEYYI
jgi:hypothetical protein